mmetsp:Transcript_2487/g.3761  ORF Transcript_2487/g.3761 Transcript_2487/m.3761 type:complete len:603 (-) Transcript_2487:271-2079(-)
MRSVLLFSIINPKNSLVYFKEIILRKILFNDFSVIVGETGCGKSTIIPIILYFFFSKKKYKLFITQPRRLAVLNVALRISTILKTRLGHKVGMKMRFFSLASNKSDIMLLTEGILLNMLLTMNNTLGKMIVIIDEFHERSVYSDIIIGICHILQVKKKKGLKFLIMTATFSKPNLLKKQFYSNIIFIKGLFYDRKIFFLNKNISNYLIAALITIFKINTKTIAGDILLFLTGKNEIILLKLFIKSLNIFRRTKSSLKLVSLYSEILSYNDNSTIKSNKINLNSSLSPDRKLYLSTNISETSLTIKNLKFVVDPGYSKLNIYNDRYQTNTLRIITCSKLQSVQRLGRIGRIGKGVIFRLFDKRSHLCNGLQLIPNIVTENINSFILFIKLIGSNFIGSIELGFYLDKEKLRRSLEILYYYNCIDVNSLEITNLGKVILFLPVDLKYGKIIIEALYNRCSYNCISYISFVSVISKNTIINMSRIKKCISGKNNCIYGDPYLIQKLNLYLMRMPLTIKYYFLQKIGISIKHYREQFKLFKLVKSVLTKNNITLHYTNNVSIFNFTIFLASFIFTALRIKTLYCTVFGCLLVKVHRYSTLRKYKLK